MPSLERPRLWIVAGPNGSGKSTLYDATDIEGFGRSVWIINPDLLAAQISAQENMPLTMANGQALDRIKDWLRASIRAHQTVGVETVLSTAKYRRLVRMAKTFGFEVRLLYVLLSSADLNVERVRFRVAKGGHAVPENKIRERRERSFRQLPWFFHNADFVLVYDNSGASPKLVARKHRGLTEIDPAAPTPIKRAATKLTK
ncbi:MAG TPA: AAA family ATPase [Rhizomicrobium sp.]|nr:AAA family ATPase [Rhizomicrobium sp.]